MLECGTQRAIQGPGPRLQEQVRPAAGPLHLLLLGKVLGDDGINRRFGKSRGDPLTGSVALTIVDQARFIAGNVNLELPHDRPELAQVGIATAEGLDIEQQIIDRLAGSIGVAVP
jgi:hypothetical protein